jgi:glutaminyl-tRNA synthetase
MYGYVVRYEGHDVDPATGEVTEVRVTHDPDSRSGEGQGGTVSATIHWVSARHALPAEVRLYDRLFAVPEPDNAPDGTDFTQLLNPDSLEVLPRAWLEPSVAEAGAGTRWQLERLGYFWPDPVDSSAERLVLNRVVGLRDSWGKAEGRAQAEPGPIAKGEGRVREPVSPKGSSDTATLDRRRATRDAARAAEPALAARMARFQKELGLTAEEADLLTADVALADFFEAAARAHGGDAGAVATWVINEVPRETRGRALSELPFGPAELARLVALVDRSVVSRLAAKEVLAELAERGGDPEEIVERRGLKQVGDRGALAAHVDAVLASLPAKVEEYRAGKKGLLGFFQGQVVRASGGSADPKVVKEMLEERLGR